jgi:hypothetical protein
MNEPQRLLVGDATSLERELLNSVLNEPIPPALQARMLAVLPLHEAALQADLGSNTTSATTTTAGTGLKALLASVGAGSLITAAWLVLPQAGPTSRHNEVASQVAVVQAPLSDRAPTPQAELDDVRVEGKSEGGPKHAASLPAATPPTETKSAPKTLAKPATLRNNTVTTGTAVVPPLRSADATLSAEVRLLDAARRAVQEGDKQRSLQLLDTYARQFPHGELSHEAQVLRRLAKQSERQ